MATQRDCVFITFCVLCCWLVVVFGRAPPKIAINSGSTLPQSVNGAVFQSDAFFVGGTAAHSEDVVGLYGSQRKGDAFSYVLTGLKPHNMYVIQFHFAELDGNKQFQRVFNVLSQNDTILLNNVDIASHTNNSGEPGQPVLLAAVVSADGKGTITLSFRGVVGDAQVCALEVYLRDDVTKDTTFVAEASNKKRTISQISQYIKWGYLPSDWYYDWEPYAWRRWPLSESIGYPNIVGGVGYLKGEDYYDDGVTWFYAAASGLYAPPGTYKLQCRWKFEADAEFSETLTWNNGLSGSVEFWPPPYFGLGWFVFQHPYLLTFTNTVNITGISLQKTPPTSFKRGISIDACWLEQCSNSSCLSINECTTYSAPCNIPDSCTDTDAGYTCTPLTPSVPVTVSSNPFVYNDSTPTTHIILPNVCGDAYPLGNVYVINGTGSNITISLSVPSGYFPVVSLTTTSGLLCSVSLPYTWTSTLGVLTTVYITRVVAPYTVSVYLAIIAPQNITTLNYNFTNFVVSSQTGSVVLSWDAPPGGNLATSRILGYTILKSPSSNYNTTSTSLVLSGLAKNTAFKFTLYIRTADFPQAQDVSISPKSPTTLPIAPVLTLSQTSASTTVLAWSVSDRGGAATLPTTYYLETSSDGLSYTTAQSNSQTFGSLSYNRVTYDLYARVKVTVSTGTSAYSNVIYLAHLRVPTAVTDFAATISIGDAFGYPALYATWTNPSDLGGGILSYFSIFYSYDQTTWSDEIDVFESGDAPEVDDFAWLSTDDVVYIQVAAVTDVGTGVYATTQATIID